ncbi:hypothetical protein DIPPA_05205 [Diplonema papillatum]|nr:hypothetical protein DIPPA_05205 [Diplonema papillatum]
MNDSNPPIHPSNKSPANEASHISSLPVNESNEPSSAREETAASKSSAPAPAAATNEHPHARRDENAAPGTPAPPGQASSGPPTASGPGELASGDAELCAAPARKGEPGEGGQSPEAAHLHTEQSSTTSETYALADHETVAAQLLLDGHQAVHVAEDDACTTSSSTEGTTSVEAFVREHSDGLGPPPADRTRSQRLFGDAPILNDAISILQSSAYWQDRTLHPDEQPLRRMASCPAERLAATRTPARGGSAVPSTPTNGRRPFFPHTKRETPLPLSPGLLSSREKRYSSGDHAPLHHHHQQHHHQQHHHQQQLAASTPSAPQGDVHFFTGIGDSAKAPPPPPDDAASRCSDAATQSKPAAQRVKAKTASFIVKKPRPSRDAAAAAPAAAGPSTAAPDTDPPLPLLERMVQGDGEWSPFARRQAESDPSDEDSADGSASPGSQRGSKRSSAVLTKTDLAKFFNYTDDDENDSDPEPPQAQAADAAPLLADLSKATVENYCDGQPDKPGDPRPAAATESRSFELHSWASAQNAAALDLKDVLSLMTGGLASLPSMESLEEIARDQDDLPAPDNDTPPPDGLPALGTRRTQACNIAGLDPAKGRCQPQRATPGSYGQSQGGGLAAVGSMGSSPARAMGSSEATTEGWTLASPGDAYKDAPASFEGAIGFFRSGSTASAASTAGGGRQPGDCFAGESPPACPPDSPKFSARQPGLKPLGAAARPLKPAAAEDPHHHHHHQHPQQQQQQHPRRRGKSPGAFSHTTLGNLAAVMRRLRGDVAKQVEALALASEQPSSPIESCSSRSTRDSSSRSKKDDLQSRRGSEASEQHHHQQQQQRPAARAKKFNAHELRRMEKELGILLGRFESSPTSLFLEIVLRDYQHLRTLEGSLSCALHALETETVTSDLLEAATYQAALVREQKIVIKQKAYILRSRPMRAFYTHLTKCLSATFLLLRILRFFPVHMTERNPFVDCLYELLPHSTLLFESGLSIGHAASPKSEYGQFSLSDVDICVNAAALALCKKHEQQLSVLSSSCSADGGCTNAADWCVCVVVEALLSGRPDPAFPMAEQIVAWVAGCSLAYDVQHSRAPPSSSGKSRDGAADDSLSSSTAAGAAHSRRRKVVVVPDPIVPSKELTSRGWSSPRKGAVKTAPPSDHLSWTAEGVFRMCGIRTLTGELYGLENIPREQTYHRYGFCTDTIHAAKQRQMARVACLLWGSQPPAVWADDPEFLALNPIVFLHASPIPYTLLFITAPNLTAGYLVSLPLSPGNRRQKAGWSSRSGAMQPKSREQSKK